MELSVKIVHSCQPLKAINAISFTLDVAAAFTSVTIDLYPFEFRAGPTSTTNSE